MLVCLIFGVVYSRESFFKTKHLHENEAKSENILVFVLGPQGDLVSIEREKNLVRWTVSTCLLNQTYV